MVVAVQGLPVAVAPALIEGQVPSGITPALLTCDLARCLVVFDLPGLALSVIGIPGPALCSFAWQLHFVHPQQSCFESYALAPSRLPQRL